MKYTKVASIFMLVFSIFIGTSSITFASDGGTTSSEASISFKQGPPVIDEGIPGDLEEIEVSKPVIPEKDNQPGEKLPKTATNMLNLLIIGVGVIVLGFLFLLFKKRKSEELEKSFIHDVDL